MEFDLKLARWLNEPEKHEESKDKIILYTHGKTDI